MSEPKKYGPYSIVREVGPLVFVSGQTGVDAQTGQADPRIDEQTRQAFKNVQNALSTVGLGLDDVVDFTVFLTDVARDFAAVNGVFSTLLSEPYPARACVGVADLPHIGDTPLLIEIKATAARPANG